MTAAQRNSQLPAIRQERRERRERVHAYFSTRAAAISARLVGDVADAVALEDAADQLALLSGGVVGPRMAAYADDCAARGDVHSCHVSYMGGRS